MAAAAMEEEVVMATTARVAEARVAVAKAVVRAAEAKVEVAKAVERAVVMAVVGWVVVMADERAVLLFLGVLLAVYAAAAVGSLVDLAARSGGATAGSAVARGVPVANVVGGTEADSGEEVREADLGVDEVAECLAEAVEVVARVWAGWRR